MRMSYVFSRAALAAVSAGVLYLGGLPWWAATPTGALVLAFFLSAPRSGRYVMRQDGGMAPLRQDERSRVIKDKAARNAFVATVLALAALTIVYGRVLDAPVPVSALGAILGLAAATYGVSDLCLRRSSQAAH